MECVYLAKLWFGAYKKHELAYNKHDHVTLAI
jgi:hypothetical protein